MTARRVFVACAAACFWATLGAAGLAVFLGAPVGALDTDLAITERTGGEANAMTDKVTGGPQVKFGNLQQLVATDLDRTQRLASKYVQDVLRAIFETHLGAAQSGVLYGLSVSAAGSGELAVDVGTGLAFIDDASDLTDATLDSRYRAALLREALSDVALDPADGTHPRIDAVVVSWAYDTWGEESRNVRLVAGGVPQAQLVDTFEGPAPVVAVVTGTPAGSPSAPSIPAGSLRLANVTVAAGATTSAGLTIADARSMLPRPSVPRDLAAATRVRGNLTVDSGVIAESALLGLGVLAGGDGVFGGYVSAEDGFRVPSTSDTQPALLARSNATGTPDASDDAVAIEVERGTAPNAQLVFDEGEDGWRAGNGSSRGPDGLVVGGYRSTDPANVTNIPLAIWTERQTLTFVGGSSSEVISVSWGGDASSRPFTGFGGDGGTVRVWAQIAGRSGSSAEEAAVDVLLPGSTGCTFTVRHVGGGNLTAGHTLTVDFLVMGQQRYSP